MSQQPAGTSVSEKTASEAFKGGCMEGLNLSPYPVLIACHITATKMAIHRYICDGGTAVS